MEFRQLATFLKLSELNSFKKTAEALNYTQSAVTIQIKSLEDELGVRLFDRFGKTVSLSTSGKIFARYASIILSEAKQAKVDLGQDEEDEQTLHIGTIESLCYFSLPSVIELLQNSSPKLHIKITTGSPTTLIDKLNHNQVDIIYMLDAPVYDVNWIKVIEKEERIVFVAKADSPFANRQNIPLQELCNQPFLLTEKADNYRYSLDQYLAKQNLAITPFLELGNTEAIINMVKAGMGLSFLPHFTVADSIGRRELTELSVQDFSMVMSKQVIYHKNKWLTSGMNAFIHLAKDGYL